MVSNGDHKGWRQNHLALDIREQKYFHGRLFHRGGVKSTRCLGPTMTARGPSIGISIAMLPQSFGATWRRLRYKRHPSTILRNLTLKKDFKRSMYQHFKFTWEYTRVGTLIVATIYLQLIQNRYMFRSFTVLQCGHQHCDFHLIPKMKEPLRGIRFRTVPEILQAVDRSIRTINTTGAAKGILRLPRRWQRVVHNAGDDIEGQ